MNEAIVAGDLDAAERLSDLGDRYVGQHALADAEAAFRGALTIFEAALGPADPRHYPYPYPVYAPAPTYQAPVYAAPSVTREVCYRGGCYLLQGDGLTVPYQWIWVPAVPAPPPGLPNG